MLTAAGAQCHLTLLIKGERFPCSQKSIFLLLVTMWLQCNKCSSSVFFLLRFLQVVVLYWTALCFRVFLIFFEIEELQSSKIAQVCKKKKVKAVTRWMSANNQS